MAEKANILIVEDDDQVSRVFVRVANRIGLARLAPNVAAAVELLSEVKDWGAFIMDVGLPDGDGLEVLACARLIHPWTPALIVTGILSDRIASAAYGLRPAACIPKPVNVRHLLAFLEEALSDPIALAIRDRAAQCALTPAITDVYMKAALDGASREQIAKERGKSPWTVRDQEEMVREKVGARSFHEAVTGVLREAARRRR
jgi:DNA-binding NarL/FixJ family response regulator